MKLLRLSNQMSFILAILLILGIASACSAATPTIAPEETVMTDEPQEPEVTETAVPTATPHPKVALVGFNQETSETSLMVQETVQELAVQNGLSVEQFSDLTMVQSLDGVQLMVIEASIPGIDSFAADKPSINVLVVGQTDLQPGGRLSLVESQGSQADHKGFIAGYLASVMTQDWRVGVITQAGSVEGEMVRAAFNNGVVFYCGLCRPVYPPFYTYPITSELAEGSSLDDQMAGSDVLIASAVKTVYVQGSVADDGLLDYLAQAGIQIIGDQPPPSHLQGQWVATIQSNFKEALLSAWQRIMAGESGFEIMAPISVQSANPDLLSSGRLRLVEQLVDELNKGLIGTGIDVGSGE